MSEPTAVDRMKLVRESIGMSQMRLARLSGVNRAKINQAEFGETTVLSDDELARLFAAMRAEARRIVAVTESLRLEA